MGTRSSIGFIKDGVRRSSYSQFDGYPEVAGQQVVDIIKGIAAQPDGLQKLEERLLSVKMVSNEKKGRMVNLSSDIENTPIYMYQRVPNSIGTVCSVNYRTVYGSKKFSMGTWIMCWKTVEKTKAIIT